MVSSIQFGAIYDVGKVRAPNQIAAIEKLMNHDIKEHGGDIATFILQNNFNEMGDIKLEFLVALTPKLYYLTREHVQQYLSFILEKTNQFKIKQAFEKIVASKEVNNKNQYKTLINAMFIPFKLGEANTPYAREFIKNHKNEIQLIEDGSL